MVGLYLIAFVGPLIVFGPIAFAINLIARSNPSFFESKQRAIALYVGLPIAVSYGFVIVASASLFISYLFTL